jgi:hypothetical protein
MTATADDYVKVLDTLAIKSAWASAMAAVGKAETTAFKWLAQSRRAMKADDKASPLYFEWREQFGFFHQHASNARVEHKMSTEAVIRQEIRDGLETKLYDGAGRPIWVVCPRAAAFKFADAEEAEICGYPDWPYLHDEKGARIQATKRELLPATTRNLLLQTIPDYQSHSTVDVKVTDVVHVAHSYLKRPADAAPPALPAPNDGDSELVKDLKRRLLEGPKNPKPDSPVHVMGRMTGDTPDRVSKPSDETPRTLADHPRAYTVPKATPPKGPPQDYGRPAPSLDSGGRGRGVVPSGGFRVS